MDVCILSLFMVGKTVNFTVEKTGRRHLAEWSESPEIRPVVGPRPAAARMTWRRSARVLPRGHHLCRVWREHQTNPDCGTVCRCHAGPCQRATAVGELTGRPRRRPTLEGTEGPDSSVQMQGSQAQFGVRGGAFLGKIANFADSLWFDS